MFNRLIFSLHSLMSRHGQVPELMFPVCSVIFKPECAIRHEPLIMSRREKSTSGRRHAKLNPILFQKARFVYLRRALSCTIVYENHRSSKSNLVPSTTFIVFIHGVLRVVCQTPILLHHYSLTEVYRWVRKRI